tara:strand:- start:33 stop:233 length:201 start_codon:yes stop_codon:yes gene_type:complete
MSKKQWHTLTGETPDKDKRMDMTQDNFYRLIAMRDEIIDEQRVEISALKASSNKLRIKLEVKRERL